MGICGDISLMSMILLFMPGVVLGLLIGCPIGASWEAREAEGRKIIDKHLKRGDS